jgi:peptidyl-tRNA hydrolase, PTH1 family
MFPLTYMNESGRSVQAAVKFFGIDAATELLVVCDDFNLELGTLRFRAEGSSGGQKGLQNIIDRLGNQKFPRLRVGVGSPPEQWSVTDFVLSRFFASEQETMLIAVKTAAEAILCWVQMGLSKTMNRFNK